MRFVVITLIDNILFTYIQVRTVFFVFGVQAGNGGSMFRALATIFTSSKIEGQFLLGFLIHQVDHPNAS